MLLTWSTAALTAANPAAASPLLFIGTRSWHKILPSWSTIPAATFVPPMSTPKNTGLFMEFASVSMIERLPRGSRSID
jgi:hypothetical protein